MATKIGVIGYGAVASYLCKSLPELDAELCCIIARDGRQDFARSALGDVPVVTTISDAPEDIDVVVDCAGHGGLIAHGAQILQAGHPLITLSIGALADDALYKTLSDAAIIGSSRLHLASGAIGALDAIASANIGRLDTVTYTGRKPPQGWAGSPAENVLDLKALTTATTHFRGTARDAASQYPKNANVAAALALAGLGFDATKVELIADPAASANIHEITATGYFGSLRFEIAGNGLPENPRTSALAAMSVVREIARQKTPIVI